jgi:hypothetical protein
VQTLMHRTIRIITLELPILVMFIICLKHSVLQIDLQCHLSILFLCQKSQSYHLSPASTDAWRRLTRGDRGSMVKFRRFIDFLNRILVAKVIPGILKGVGPTDTSCFGSGPWYTGSSRRGIRNNSERMNIFLNGGLFEREWDGDHRYRSAGYPSKEQI